MASFHNAAKCSEEHILEFEYSGGISQDNGLINQRQNSQRNLANKIYPTACIVLLYVGLGLWSGIIAPTTVDMVELHNSTYELFVRATTMKAIGAMFGSFLGAFISDKFITNADLVIFVMSAIGGIACIAVPWSNNLYLMGFIFSLTGLSHGTLNVVCHSVCFSLWGDATSRPFQVLQFAYTMGVIIAPAISIPFLSNNEMNNSSHMMTSQNNFLPSYYRQNGNVDAGYKTEEGHLPYEAPSYFSSWITHVHVPYGVCGLWTVFISVAFLILFCCKNSNQYSELPTGHRKRFSTKEICNPGLCANGNKSFGLVFVVFTVLVYICIQGRDRGLSAYLFVIANQGELHLQKSNSAILVIVYIVSSIAGKTFVDIVLSKLLKIQISLFLQIITASYFQLLLLFYGLTDVKSFWILVCLVSFFTGPTLSSFMTWSDRYIEVTGTVVAIIDIALAAGTFGTLWTSGHLYEQSGTVGVFSVGFVSGLMLLTVLVVLQIISHLKGDRYMHLHLENSVNYPDLNCDSESDDERSKLLP